MSIRFDDRVAIVTGAGAGLGRTHALLLAERGAKVVVNDLGGAMNGEGGTTSAADGVVAEIKAKGGTAIANYASVSDPEGATSIAKAAMDAFGRIDILINNAGILRDKSFIKMEDADFMAVLQVHLLGSVYCTRAVWPIMNERKYGRIVMTTSVAGTHGNFGQTNYSAAKMGLLGFMNALAIEGVKNNILVNAISPGAATRMTENLLKPSLKNYMGPELVSPAVAWLASEDCKTTATIISASAGGYARVQFFETEHVQFDPEQPITLEMISEAFPKISDFATAKPTRLGVFGDTEARLKKVGRA